MLPRLDGLAYRRIILGMDVEAPHLARLRDLPVPA
jgi:hypothetical protein